jgi:hypothetical protein
MSREKALELAAEYKRDGYREAADVAYRICRDRSVYEGQRAIVYEWIREHWEEL